MYCKAKKFFGAIRKFLKIFIFENLLHEKGLKGGISIDTDSGPHRYVLWCCGGTCRQPDTFIQIGYTGHTVSLRPKPGFKFSVPKSRVRFQYRYRNRTFLVKPKLLTNFVSILKNARNWRNQLTSILLFFCNIFFLVWKIWWFLLFSVFSLKLWKILVSE